MAAFVLVVGSAGALVIRIIGAPLALILEVAALESDAVPVSTNEARTPSRAAYMCRR
jgi:hypothetical protein